MPCLHERGTAIQRLPYRSSQSLKRTFAINCIRRRGFARHRSPFHQHSCPRKSRSKTQHENQIAPN
jgi:hypothetical protein